MKHLKLKNILAISLICIMIAALSGCNYINRPEGAKNNSTDNNNRLAGLLLKDKEVTIPGKTETVTTPGSTTTTPSTTTEDDNEDDKSSNEPQADPGNKDDESSDPADGKPVEPPVVSTDTPFNIAGDVVTKIDAILGSLTTEVVDATSSTGVKDELMAARNVSMAFPYKVFDGQSDAIDAIAGKLNMSINATIVNGDFVSSMKRSVLTGEKIDLMYTDQQAWGYSQHFTQDITNFVNFDIADKLGTFSSALSSKFEIYSAIEGTKSMVASGIGAPYLLVYNKDNIVVPTDAVLAGDELTGLAEVKISDPVTMFNAGSWGVSAFTEILKSSTLGGRVGLASLIDDDRNLDMWMGMENNASMALEYSSLLTQVDSPIIGNETIDLVADNMDLLQSWYWTLIGNDKSNNLASWTDISNWSDTVSKVLGTYTGLDAISSYSFMGVDLNQYSEIKTAASAANIDLEFVSIPYGYNTEQTIRSSLPDEEGKLYDSANIELKPWAAGWIGGFSVLKNCENPSVALRVAEEFTTAWKTNYEKPILDTMTADQQARYKTMKDNIGISFFRSVVYNAENVYSVYGADISDRLPKDSRNQYTSLQMFSDSKGSLTQPMYRKNTSKGLYDANTYNTWREFYFGKIDDKDGTTKLSNSILPVLSAAFVPPTMLFIY